MFDRAAGTVALPPSFLRSYSAYAAGGWDRLQLPIELGGSADATLRWAAAELMLGANPAAYCSARPRASRRSGATALSSSSASPSS